MMQFNSKNHSKHSPTMAWLSSVLILVAALGFLSFNTDTSSLDDHEDREEWGFFGHRRINRMAVFTLPPDMIAFYKKNIEYITKHAVDPDMRRYIIEGEAPRHYIDIDHYGEPPFDNVPRKWNDAMAKFTEVFVVNNDGDTIQLMGDNVINYTPQVITLNGDNAQKIFGKDKVSINTPKYINFVRSNILNQYYELDWKLSLDSLNKVFQTDYFTTHCQEAYAEDYLGKYGIVNWHLESMLRRLTKAFQNNDQEKILKYSANIGHYIGDAHVPLHTTENYNGQLTNQVGIHGFWESRLPELFANDYNYFVGKADYITQPNPYFWDVVLTSHSLLDSVLIIERSLTQEFSADKKYCYETRGEYTIRTYCKEFAAAYHQRMAGMVETRMRDAIQSVGSVWFTAWVNAGQPDLNRLDGADIAQEDEQPIQVEGKKIKGRPHDN